MTNRIFKREIAIGDLHGCFDLLKDMVENIIQFNPNEDKLIFLGDYIDRGLYSMKVILYLQTLKHMYPDNIVLLLGNHELLAYDYLKCPKNDKDFKNHELLWFQNGGRKTIESFGNIIICEKILIPFIQNECDLYYENDKYIFVHGGIPKDKSLYTASPDTLVWNREFDNPTEKILIVGHSPQIHIAIFITDVIVVDTGAVFTGKLSAFDVIENKPYIVEHQPLVYEVEEPTEDIEIEELTGKLSAFDKVYDFLKDK